MALKWPTQTNLPVKVEILLNGTWTDITRYVYQRDGIQITGGAPDESSKPQPSQLTLTLNNRDGRFTPRYTGGAYYPYLVRNTQIRLSVTVTTVTNAAYTGFRFWGEVPDWPPRWNENATDVYVQVTASGPLRRINQGGGQGSALIRYYGQLAPAYAPIAYWPCEEDPQVSQIQTGQPGGNVMTITGNPVWKAVSSFNGSAPIGILNGSTWDGLTGSVFYSGDDVFTTPGMVHSWTCPPGVSTVNCKCWGPGDFGLNASGTTGGQGGGGGEFAQETALAVTPGKVYGFTVYGGGQQRAQTFPGDSVTVTANPGINGTGGSGSTNTVHFSGGNGGTGAAGGGGGGGGGGSGGTAAAGNTGGNASGTTGGAGAAAVTGGGAGGRGAFGGNSFISALSGTEPGGGGGGQDGGGNTVVGFGGGAKVELIYTPPAAPSANVFRFILFVPATGGNSGKILARMLTGGTIHRVDVLYVSTAKLQVKGYDVSNNLKFDSGAQAFPVLGLTFMVSVELTTSGTSVAWKFTGIVPGADTVFAAYTGTVASASIGNVTEVIVAPNGDITKTAMGHFSVQYALIDLTKVSRALNGHHTEMSIDRFIRLANEQAMDAEPGWNESADHWDFEGWTFTTSGTPLNNTYFIVTTNQSLEIKTGDQFTSSVNGTTVFTVTAVGAPFSGFVNVSFFPTATSTMSNPSTVTTSPNLGTQGWTAGNGAVTQAAVFVAQDDFTQIYQAPYKWPVWKVGSRHSLLLTANGAGAPSARAPAGTSGQPVLPGDKVSAAADVYVPVALTGNIRAQVNWYNSSGTYLSTTTGTGHAISSGEVRTASVSDFAPATAAFFEVVVSSDATEPNGRLIYVDHVRVHPHMGPQTRQELKHFLEEIKNLDQGILRESRKLFGLGYRTRISLINQSPKLTLDYAQRHLSGPLEPVTDDLHTKNDITVHRHKGSKVRVTLDDGSTMSVSEPPAGAGRYRKRIRAVAEADEQLLALASHLLTLGTWNGERYPTITVQLIRPELASLLPVIASVEIGDFVQLVNLPFFTPNATANQIVTGYTETLNARQWTITWNCQPENPFEIIAASMRRW